MKATVFEFTDFEYKKGSAEILFHWRTHFADTEPLDFTEKITLADANWVEKLPVDFVEAILQDLHFILGISYYKLFCAPEFKHGQQLSKEQTAFWNTIYTDGLGEFLYRNGLRKSNIARFAGDATPRSSVNLPTDPTKLLTGIGGGKDSIVSLELLRQYEQTGFVVETGKENTQTRRVTEIAELPLATIKRELDEKLIIGVMGTYNGHVPISAVYAFLGVLQAAVSGQGYFVVSNEHSSNFGNIQTEDGEVNHQWSKSTEFEKLFQNYLRNYLTPNIGYFSLLRPFYELRIVKMFVGLGEKYFQTFSSCNRNFTHHHDGQTNWCGECPKCAFAFLMLAAFLDKETLINIFKKDLLNDEALLPTYRDLLGFGDLKPFDCVGTFDESKLAMQMASKNFSDSLVVKEFLPQLGDLSALEKEIFSAHPAPTIPSRFRVLGMESALILGYGREGHGTEKYLKQKYPNLKLGIADQVDGPDYINKQNDYDLVVKTPVIPSALVTRQETTATQLFLSEVSRKKLIGVTGSKGKSTTTTLIYQMLKAGGLKVRLLGNIGNTALESLLEKPIESDEWLVFEFSSYQLEDIDVSPHIAVMTALFPEHLDHHGTLQKYFDAKRRITLFQDQEDFLIYPHGFPELEVWAKETKAQAEVSDSLPFKINNPHLLGEHNASNAALAAAVAKKFGVSDEVVEKVVSEYEGLPHRLQHLGEYQGIVFYDDSISTTPESTIAALRALPSVDTLLLGGVDRGYDFSELREVVRQSNVRNLILFPESGNKIFKDDDRFNVLRTDNMEEAVKFALANTKSGNICLLSPAAPSYNLFKNFEERGEKFKELAEKLSV